MAFIVTDFNEYKSYGNCLNERFIFHLAILKGVARMGKYFSVSIEALAPKQPCIPLELHVHTIHVIVHCISVLNLQLTGIWLIGIQGYCNLVRL